MNNIARVLSGIRSGGQFDTHHRADGEVSLGSVGDINGEQLLEAVILGRFTTFRDPAGVTETRAALRNTRGDAGGAIRTVRLTWLSVPAASDAGDFEVVGPRDGRPLIVHLHAGLPRLVVKSGNVIVVADSGAGHSVNVEDGASATIVAGAGRRKISTTTKRGAKVVLHAEPLTFGYQSVEFGGDFSVHGDAPGITVGRRDS